MRASCSVLREPRGEIPRGYSTVWSVLLDEDGTSLLRYPDVDIRLLAANACLDLLTDETTNPSFLLQMWPNLNKTQKEHLVSVLFSFAMVRPEKVNAWILDLLSLVET